MRPRTLLSILGLVAVALSASACVYDRDDWGRHGGWHHDRGWDRDRDDHRDWDRDRDWR